MLMLGIPAATGQLDFRQVASAVAMFAGTVSQFISNISDVNYHSFQAIFNGASSVLFCGGSAGTSCSVAGVSNSISPGASTASGGVLAIGNATAANALQMTEGAIWAIGFSGTQEANMAANQAGYWGPY